MNEIIIAALIQLTDPSGSHSIYVNPAEVSSARQPLDIPGRWPKGAHCIVSMTNGRFNAVMENCDVVSKKLYEAPKRQGPCTLVCGEAPRR